MSKDSSFVVDGGKVKEEVRQLVKRQRDKLDGYTTGEDGIIKTYSRGLLAKK